MPLSPASLSEAAGPDVSQMGGASITPQLPVQADAPGTPSPSGLEAWGAAARYNPIGQWISNQQIDSGGLRTDVHLTEPDALALIPKDLRQYADEYFGLETPAEINYRTQQLRRKLADARVLQAYRATHPIAGGAFMFASGFASPGNIASLLVPGAGELNLATRISLGAGIGAGGTALDEALTHQVDPTHTYEGLPQRLLGAAITGGAQLGAISGTAGRARNAAAGALAGAGGATVQAQLTDDDHPLFNVGASSVLAGLLGALHGRVPPDERAILARRLQEDLDATIPRDITPHSGDSFDALANEIRAAAEAHAAGLAAAPEVAGGPVAPEARTAAEERLATAQQAIAELEGQALPAEGRDARIQAEAERLMTPDTVAARLRNQYGDLTDQVVRARAEATIGRQEQEHAQAIQRAHDEAAAAQQELDRLNATETLQERSSQQASLAAGVPRGTEPAQQAEAPATVPPPPPDSAPVEQLIRAQLDQLGHIPEEQRDAYAMLASSAYRTLATRSGMSPTEFFSRYPLRIAGQGPGAYRQATGPMFHSALEAAIRDHTTLKAPASQWLGTLRNVRGVTPDELEWTGILSNLERLGKQTLSREDVLELARLGAARVNPIVKGEHTYGGEQAGPLPEGVTLTRDEANDLHVLRLGDAVGEGHGLAAASGKLLEDLEALKATIMQRRREAMKAGETGAATQRWVDDELASTEPDLQELNKHISTVKMWRVSMVDRPLMDYRFRRFTTPGGENYREHLLQLANGPGFDKSHWEEPDIIAHTRTTDRTDVTGTPVLHAEEIQSDWHQQGREHGYYDSQERAHLQEQANQLNLSSAPERSAAYEVLERNDNLGFDSARQAFVAAMEHTDWWERWPDINSEDRAIVQRAIDSRLRWQELDRRAYESGRQPPDAPFKKSWPELALKYLIRTAVEEGKTRLTWSAGETQNARYRLTKVVDALTFRPTRRGEAGDVRSQPGQPALDGYLYGFKDGHQVFGKPIGPGELTSYVGKETAVKLLASTPDSEGFHSLHGQELEVGGLGMRGFYDKMFVDLAGRYAKRFGGQVGETRINTEPEGSYSGGRRGQMNSEPVHYLDISPALRRMALEGQPLFQRRAPAPGAPGQGDLFAENRPTHVQVLEAAEGFTTRTEPKQIGTREIPVSLVRTPTQAASAFMHLVDSPHETLEALITDADGKPLAFVGGFKGGRDAAQFNLPTFVAEMMQIPGGRYFWLGHNHPSGVEQLSHADEMVESKMALLMRGTGMESRGILAIGGREQGTKVTLFSHTSDETGFNTGQTFGGVEGVNVGTQVPVVTRVFSKAGTMSERAIEGPTQAQAFAKERQFGDGLLLLDNRHRATGFLPLVEGAERVRGSELARAYLDTLSRSNASAVILIDRTGEHRDALRNIGGIAGSLEMRILDAVTGPEYRSDNAFASEVPGSFRQAGELGSYDPHSFTMTLGAQADRSTFIHEAGHHFLNVLTQLGAREDAPASIRNDVQALMDWFKVPDVNAWHALGIEGQRAAHEQFARGFEDYAQAGVAPTTALQSVFDRFREWLSEIYRRLTGGEKTTSELLQQLPPEVRGVMDRMLALDDEIRATKVERLKAASSNTMRRVATDDALRQQLLDMTHREAGWAEIGGRMIRIPQGDHLPDVIQRTPWVPRADWWPGRPGGYNEQELQNLVSKALRGERLGPKQQRMIDYMVEVADARVSNEPYLPDRGTLQGAGLEAGNPHDENEAAMVTRATLIDEATVEAFARRFEDDDAGFMRAIKEYLDAHDTDAAIARSGPQESEPHGDQRENGAPARGAAAAEGGGAQVREPPGGTPRQPAPGAGGGELELTQPGGTAGPQQPAHGPAGSQRDLFGGRSESAQRLSEEQARRDAARNTGQESPETGQAGDLFSQANAQQDLLSGPGPNDHFRQDPRQEALLQMLQALPAEQRAAFLERIAKLQREQQLRSILNNPTGSLATPGKGEFSVEDLSLARGGRMIGKALGWFAPGTRLLRSPSLAARVLTTRLAETPELLSMNMPSAERPFGVPTPTAVETRLRRWEGTWAAAKKARTLAWHDYNEALARDPSEGLPEGSKPRESMTHAQFREQVSAALRRGDQHPFPEVARAAKATRELLIEPLSVEAEKLGLLDRAGMHGTADSYLTRLYDRFKIRNNRGEWHKLLVEGFTNPEGYSRQMTTVPAGMPPAEAMDLAHKVTGNILGAEMGILDWDDNVFRATVPQSGRLIERKLLLPDTLLEPFLQNDVDHVTHAFVKTLAPQVEVTRTFGDKDMMQALNRVRDEYSLMSQAALAEGDNLKANELTDRMKADLRDLMGIRDRMYGIFGTPSDPTGWMQRGQRMIRSYNALRLLGTATWSHIPDLGNIVLRHGLTRTWGTAMQLASSLEALKLNRDEVQRIGSALDLIHNSTAAQLGEFGQETSYPVQRLLSRSARAFTIATLETPWIAVCKALAAATAHDEVLHAAERVGRGEKLGNVEMARFNQLGVGQLELERIAQEYQNHGQQVNGLRFGHTDRWTDRGAADALDAATVRAGESSTLTPGKGDTPLWTSSEIGKSIFQFKTFGAVAIRRVLIPLAQGVAMGDIRAASGLATLVAAGAATYVMKQMLSGQPIEKKQDRFALEVLDKSNLLGWTGEFLYPALWSFGAGNFSRWGDRQTWETLGGPVFGTAVDAWDLRFPAKAIGTFVTHDPQGPHLSRGDIHRIRRLLPANQVWYLRRAVNNLEGETGDMLDLPPEPPKGSTE